MTKAELTQSLMENMGLVGREAKGLVEAFFSEIADTLASGEEVKLSGFGSFELRSKPARPGRNPKTGVAVPITARRVVTFHPSAKLKGTVEARLPPRTSHPSMRSDSDSHIEIAESVCV